MTSEILASNESQVKKIVIVPRAAIPAIYSIEQQGKIHQLGELRDFQWHEALKNFLPSTNNLSISWVCLKPGEILQEHLHPIQSMMIFYQGFGQMLGQKNQKIQAGDIVVVPPGCLHGFIGGDKGLYALSIQFGTGLYTDPQNVRVIFNEEDKHLKTLHHYHKQRLKMIQQAPFFNLFREHCLNHSEKLQKLLNCMSLWNYHLNTPLFARYDSYKNVQENFFDPVLEALLDWFPYQMEVLDQAEKYLIRHWIIEDFAQIYHEIAHAHIEKTVYYQNFVPHFRIDQSHNLINEAVLQHLRSIDYHRLKKLLIISWNHFSVLLDRMYVIIQSTDYNPIN